MFTLFKKKLLTFIKNRNKNIENDDKSKRICYDMGVKSISTETSTKEARSMVSAIALSNTILKRAFEEKVAVFPMKLQKLVYFIFRDYYQKHDKLLLSEAFLTWKYGPVLRSVYDEFKSFHANKITRFAKDANGIVYVIDENIAPDISSIINAVWSKYKEYDGISLSQLTHEKGTAWQIACESDKPCLNVTDIKNEELRH